MFEKGPKTQGSKDLTREDLTSRAERSAEIGGRGRLSLPSSGQLNNPDHEVYLSPAPGPRAKCLVAASAKPGMCVRKASTNQSIRAETVRAQVAVELRPLV